MFTLKRYLIFYQHMYISKIFIYYVTIGYILISRFIVYIFVCLIFFCVVGSESGLILDIIRVVHVSLSFLCQLSRVSIFVFYISDFSSFFSIISEFLLFFLFVVCFSGRIFQCSIFYLGYSVCCSLFVLMGGASYLAGTGFGLPTFLFLYCI